MQQSLSKVETPRNSDLADIGANRSESPLSAPRVHGEGKVTNGPYLPFVLNSINGRCSRSKRPFVCRTRSHIPNISMMGLSCFK